MPGSNRGIYIVATIAAFAVFGLTITNETRCQRQYFEDASSLATSKPDSGKSLRFDRRWLPCLVERETANPYANEVNEKEQRDLIAQEAMALWAFWVAAFAGITALITGTGTLLIWRQVKLTRQAVQGTSDATKAMQKANDIAASAQRAWIDITPVIEIEPLSRDRVYLATSAKFKNIGKTVATNVNQQTRFFAGSFGDVMQEHNRVYRQMRKIDVTGHSLMPGREQLGGGQRTNGFVPELVDWDENNKACFAIIAIAIYNVEGDDLRRVSRTIWYLQKKQGFDSIGGPQMTWADFTSGEIEVESNGWINCT